MKKKTKAVLGAIVVYLATNALMLAAAFIGGQLGIRPYKPTPPRIILQIFPLLVAFYYYRIKVGRD